MTCHVIALRVAQDFDEGVMSYSDGDGIMNTLWASITHRLTVDCATTPALDFAIAVFDAFDAGECVRRDGDDRPPWQRFTVPLIRSILTGLNEST